MKKKSILLCVPRFTIVLGGMNRQKEINWLLSREWVWEMRKRVVSEGKISYVELPKMLILFTKEP